MSEVIYRQRLTGTGWLGAFLFIGGQVIGGFALKEMVSETMRTYGDPTAPALALAACGIAIFSGLVMVLVGREYYPFTAVPLHKPSRDEKPDKQAEIDRRVEEHFGKPV